MTVGIWEVGRDRPRRAVRSKVDLEASLEDWIAADPALLSEGLRVIGQQISLDAGRLDLLGIDAQGRWVVIELKKERLHRETVAQALDYAACLRRIDAEDLAAKLRPNLASFGDPDDLGLLVQEQLDSEDGEREVAVTLVGTGVDAGLERVVDYLAEFQLPVSVVTFEVFALDSGEQLLVRDIIEEQVEAPTGISKMRSLEDIERQAVRYGVGEEFDRLVSAAEAAGLFVRPYVRSVTITPPSHRNRVLMALRPKPDGRLGFTFGPDAFDEFFDDLTAEDVTDELGVDTDLNLSGQHLQDVAATIEAFLEELPAPTERDPDGPSADTATVIAIAGLVRAGEWTTYGDISTVAIGRASAAMAVGNIARTRSDFPNAHRLLTRHGTVPTAWTDGAGGGPEVCRGLLVSEGIDFDVDGRADPRHRVAVDELVQRFRSFDHGADLEDGSLGGPPS